MGERKLGWMNRPETAKLTTLKKTSDKCSVEGCVNPPVLTAYIYQPAHSENIKIVPMCAECNLRKDEFSLRNGTKLVPHTNIKT